MRILFIVNPTSGRNSNDKAILAIHEIAAQNGMDFKFLYTQGDDDDKAIKKELSDYKPDRVVACGGDGTVQVVARNMIGSKIPLGIFPLGSANGLATALNISSKPEEALHYLAGSNQVVPFDILRINKQHHCIHLSDLGTNALLVKNYEESGDKGWLGYAKHFLSSVQQSDIFQFNISTKAESITKEGVMLVIANAHKYGTGVQISEGSVSDGMFEICNVKTIDLESVVKAGLNALNVLGARELLTDVIATESAHIEISAPAHLQIDGEYIGEVSSLSVDMIPAAIKMMIPHET